MKLLSTFLFSCVLYSTLQASIFLQEDSKQNQIIFNSIINSSLKNLSVIFKQNTASIIQELKKQSIQVRNEEQTIVQIALANAKEASDVINVIIKNINKEVN
jgi:hypothetical protein